MRYLRWTWGAAVIAAVVLAFAAAGSRPMHTKEPPAVIPLFNARTGSVDLLPRVIKTDAGWRRVLTPEQYHIMREQGTEPPSGEACAAGTAGGIYECAGCGTDLFAIGAKFESGTGWPSFWEPVSGLNVVMKADPSHGMTRVEVSCARCGAHLGHVFDDGPPPSGARYCINAAALVFVPYAGAIRVTRTATFAAGCFWGVEEAFRAVKGVVYTRVGYTGGRTRDPAYEDVSTGTTGHAESVEIYYDPDRVTYRQLLDVFWKTHDPTTLNRQGPDVGTQYRSAIFYHDAGQMEAAESAKEALERSGDPGAAVVTRIERAGPFYPAEEYHQRYHEKRGGGVCP